MEDNTWSFARGKFHPQNYIVSRGSEISGNTQEWQLHSFIPTQRLDVNERFTQPSRQARATHRAPKLFILPRPTRLSCTTPACPPYESASSIHQERALSNLVEHQQYQTPDRWISEMLLLHTLVSNECSLTICGLLMSLASLSTQVPGASTSVSV